MQEMIASSEKINHLREKRKFIKERILQEENKINQLIKVNLDLFDYITKVEYKEICDTNKLETNFNYLIEKRIEELCKETYKQILMLYESIIIPHIKKERDDKNLLVILENFVKFLYCLEKFIKKEKIESNFSISFNLVTLECLFISNKEVLTTINPIILEWNTHPYIKQLLNKSIIIPFNTEELNIYIMKKKLDLFIKYLKMFMNYKKEELINLNSYFLPLNFQITNLIKEKDANLNGSESVIKEFLNEVNNILLLSELDEENKALIFSYMVFVNEGIISYVDLTYFYGNESYYYVKWIDYRKEND